MRKFFYLLLIPLCMGMVACGGDDSEDEPLSPPNKDVSEQTDVREEEKEINQEVLAKYVSANISFDESKQLWTANIQTTLASKYPDKDIKYGMVVTITTRYVNDRYREIWPLFWYDGDADPLEGIYATGSGNSYNVSVNNIFYMGMSGCYDDGKKVMIDDIEDDDNYIIEQALHEEEVRNYQEKVENGTVTEQDRIWYENACAWFEYYENKEVSYTMGLYSYCESIAQVFVEIDGRRYIVKEENGPVRLCVYSLISYELVNK